MAEKEDLSLIVKVSLAEGQWYLLARAEGGGRASMWESRGEAAGGTWSDGEFWDAKQGDHLSLADKPELNLSLVSALWVRMRT